MATKTRTLEVPAERIQARLRLHFLAAGMPPEFMWQRNDAVRFAEWMKWKAGQTGDGLDQACAKVAHNYIEKIYARPAKQEIYFQNLHDPFKWGRKGFSLPDWKIVRWALRLLGVTVYDPRSIPL